MKLIAAALLVALSVIWCRGKPLPANNDPVGDFFFNSNLTSSTGKRYALVNLFKSNWFYAFMHCVRSGMRLASVENAEEFSLLVATLKAAGYHRKWRNIWTAGTDAGHEGEFFWMSTGKPLTFLVWRSGEPNNQDEDGTAENCLALDGAHNDGKYFLFNDVNCTYDRSIACEYYPQEQERTPPPRITEVAVANPEDAILWKSFNDLPSSTDKNTE